MATEERLPHACAFARSVLAEYDLDPDAVPEEAVEAAQQHVARCARCQNAAVGIGLQRKKKDSGSPLETERVTSTASPVDASSSSNVERMSPPRVAAQATIEREGQLIASASSVSQGNSSTSGLPAPLLSLNSVTTQVSNEDHDTQALDCQQCRQLLPHYAEALDKGENVALLYPEVQMHLLTCESGCLVLLDLCRQEAKINRKFRRRPVRDPFSAVGWELSGFFRGGQIPMSPKALSYGTLMLLLLVASLSAFLGIRWNDARYHAALSHVLPTPDGIGLSDGLKTYDACNSNGYRLKREAAEAMHSNDPMKADQLLTTAIGAASTDTTGCNGAEAAIYREDLHVRQSGRPFSYVVVSFDSGPGNADPQGGTDRHILFAAYTQELVGAFIAQQQYNSAQMQLPGAPLLYLILANTTGTEQGALQLANSLSDMSHAATLDPFGLLAKGPHPLLAALGFGPSSLIQVVLPRLCLAGIPLIAPTATGLFIVDLLTQTSLYRHCAPGFGFIRFSPDDARQSQLASAYAYNQLHVRHAAIFYDPSNPSSAGSAQAFSQYFAQFPHAHLVAQETAVASGLLDSNGRPQASREDISAGLNNALSANPRPDLIFAPLLTNDVITLAQDITRLPAGKQPILMIGGEFVQPTALQGLVQWARQQQLTLPRMFVSISAAVRPPNSSVWPKQFYASFCTSFATPGSFCSGAAALDQGALLFTDGIEIVSKAIGSISDLSKLPSRSQLVRRISAEHFDGVSCPIALRMHHDVLVTSTSVLPVILGVQDDGSIQIVG